MSKTNNGLPTYRSLLTVYTLLILAGALAWVYSLIYGLGVTGMRNVVSWGLYIITFTYFIKLSAGGLIMASAAEIFNIAAFKPLSRLGVLVAACCVFAAALAILPDLGRPDRILNLLLHPNWDSPLIWDVSIITIYLGIALADLWLMTADRRRQWHVTGLKVLACIGIPAAFSLHSITAWIFGLQISRPFWNSAIMAPLFVNSAILSGTALITLIVLILQRVDGLAVAEATWRKLGRLMAVTLAIDLYFLASKYVTILWGGVPRELDALTTVLPGGGMQLSFWLVWGLCGLVPFIILVTPRLLEKAGALTWSALLILAGVYASQYEMITVGFKKPLLQFAPGVSLGTFQPGNQVFQVIGQYQPTWVEYTIILGFFALVAMLITVGYHRLALKTEMRAEAIVSLNPVIKG
jgi:dimethyl sulfoxide reductase membrane subunit